MKYRVVKCNYSMIYLLPLKSRYKLKLYSVAVQITDTELSYHNFDF